MGIGIVGEIEGGLGGVPPAVLGMGDPQLL